jgi:hypothetical protein
MRGKATKNGAGEGRIPNSIKNPGVLLSDFFREFGIP